MHRTIIWTRTEVAGVCFSGLKNDVYQNEYMSIKTSIYLGIYLVDRANPNPATIVN